MKTIIIIIFYIRCIQNNNGSCKWVVWWFAMRFGVCYPLMFSVSSCRPLSISHGVSDLNLPVFIVCVCKCVCFNSQWSGSSLTLHRNDCAALQLCPFFSSNDMYDGLSEKRTLHALNSITFFSTLVVSCFL